MSWWQVWDAIKRPLTDRSEPVKTGQNGCKDDASASKGDAAGANARGCQRQKKIGATSQSDRASEGKTRYERDIEALSKNWYPPDIRAFAGYLRAGERGGSIELLFEHLWEAHVIHCDESNRWAMTPRQLQNACKTVGHTRRESTGVAPRRRWYLLPDDNGEKSVEAHLVTFSPRRGMRR